MPRPGPPAAPPLIRSLALVLGPALLTVTALIHPTGTDLVHMATHQPQLWLTVHVIQLPLFGLVAVSLFLLARSGSGWARAVNLVGLWLFVVFHTAMDTLAGIASGLLALRSQDLPADERQVVLNQISAFSADFSAPLADAGWAAFTLTLLGGLGWVAATLGAAACLWRSPVHNGAAVLVALSATYFVHDAPTAPVAMALLTAGAVWAALSPHDPTNPGPTGQPSGQTGT
ncbi:hypothetical protein [Nocardiopsis oceani]